MKGIFFIVISSIIGAVPLLPQAVHIPQDDIYKLEEHIRSTIKEHPFFKNIPDIDSFHYYHIFRFNYTGGDSLRKEGLLANLKPGYLPHDAEYDITLLSSEVHIMDKNGKFVGRWYYFDFYPSYFYGQAQYSSYYDPSIKPLLKGECQLMFTIEEIPVGFYFGLKQDGSLQVYHSGYGGDMKSIPLEEVLKCCSQIR